MTGPQECRIRKTKVAAHTGCGLHPDNTFASFMEGIQIGADIVEVDVRTDCTGVPILMHDNSPLLDEFSFEQLNEPNMRRRLGSAYVEHEIATLEQILSASAPLGTLLNLDLKQLSSIAPAVNLIRSFQAQNRVYITGCSDAITSLYPDIQVMMNTPDELTPQQVAQYEPFASSICRKAKQEGYAGLNMNGYTCLPPIVDAAHREGLLVWVYTINEVPHMEWFLRMGVDAITTRAPGLLIPLVDEIHRSS